MMISLLLLVPVTAMGLVLGLGRLEDTPLRVPAAVTGDRVLTPAVVVAR